MAGLTAKNTPRISLLLRVALAIALGYGLAHAGALLGLALPLSRTDAVLTAAMFSFAVCLPVLFWAVGALELMRLSIVAMVCGAALVTAILLLR